MLGAVEGGGEKGVAAFDHLDLVWGPHSKWFGPYALKNVFEQNRGKEGGVKGEGGNKKGKGKRRGSV